MTVPRKGSRSIVVDDVAYRWRIRKRPTYAQAVLDHSLTLAVDIADAPLCSLLVELSQPHPSNWIGAPSDSVTPHRVADVIRNALAAGWQPSTPGKAFKLKVDAE